jgi:hypothetical protein
MCVALGVVDVARSTEVLVPLLEIVAMALPTRAPTLICALKCASRVCT